MKNLCRLSILLCVLAVGMSATSADAYLITMFGPSAYNSNTALMDATLGLTGFNIENFEDTTLIPGLSASGTNFNLSVSLPPAPWDGSRAMFLGNQPANITFSLAALASKVGIGMTFVNNSGHTVKINGGSAIDFTALPGFVFGNVRNGYLIIDQQSGDAPITSLTFTNASLPSETLLMDHLAFNVVPEPSSLILFAVGILGVLGYGYRRRKKAA
jgi:hypothetical protein